MAYVSLFNELVQFQLQIQSLKYICLQYKNLHAMQATTVVNEVCLGSTEPRLRSIYSLLLAGRWLV